MNMVKAVFTAAMLSAITAVAMPESVSKAQWLWAEPADNPPMSAYMRLKFDVKGAVKSAWFYQFADKRCENSFNGAKISPRPWPRLNTFGHVKGSGVDLKPLVRQGENVLAFAMERNAKGAYGLILRGEVEFEDGRKIMLFSSPDMVKGSPVEAAGWKEPGFDDSSWKPAWSQGDVRTTPWSTYGNVPKLYMTPDEYGKYVKMLTKGFPEKQLLSEPEDTSVRVVYSGTTPGISINGGRPLPPDRLTTVHPMSSAAQDETLARGRKAGIPAFEIFANHTFQSGKGQFDFSALDLAIRHNLSIWPEAYVYFAYALREMGVKAWINAHPDECVAFADEKPGRTGWGDYSGNPRVPSFASKAYRDEVRRFVLALGEFCRRQPWGRRVIGMHDGYGGSGDGMPYGCHSMPDTGKRMTEAFRAYLAEKYGTDAALRKAWGDETVTLATATVPDKVKRCGSGAFLRDLGDPRDVRRADFLDAYQREFNAYELGFCKAVKEAFPGRLAGAYYGYVILSYEPEGSTARFEELLASPYVDYMKATTRGYNLTDGLHRQIPSVFHRYGKIASIEGDVRTHLGLAPGQGEPKWCCRTPEETRSTVSKFVMNARMLGTGWHSVDFGKRNVKWFNCEEAMEPIAASERVWEKNFASPPQRAADVAVIFDVNEVWREGPPQYRAVASYQDNLVTFPLQTLNFSGYAYDFLAPEDYLASPKPYRAVVFLNTCYDTPALRTAAAKARKDGSASIWCATPALSTANGWSEKSMRDLTGINLRFCREKRPFTAKRIGGGEGYAPFKVSPEWKESPRVFADDPAAETIATWSDDGTAAFAWKRLDDGTVSVFLGMPCNKVDQWVELLESVGCHAFAPKGFMVRRDSRYLMVFSGKDGTIPPESIVMTGQMAQTGKLEIVLERRYSKICDVMTGETVAENTDRFELSSNKPRVWYLETE